VPRRRPDSERASQTLALCTVGIAVVLALWNLRGASWSQAPSVGATALAGHQGFVLATLLAAAVSTAGIAVIRPQRREFLWFGALCVVVGARLQTSLGFEGLLAGPPEQLSRWWAALEALSCAVGTLFVAAVVRQPGRRDVRWVAGLGLTITVVGVPLVGVWPRAVLYLNDALALVTIATCARLYVGALRDRVPGVLPVAVAAGCISMAAILDLFVDAPLTDAIGESSLLLFVVTVELALMAQLGEASEWYEALISEGHDAILVIGRDGYVQAGNPAAAALLERPLRGLGLLEAVLPEDRPLAAAHLNSGERSRRAELRLVTASGSVVHVESQATALPEGRSVLLVRDITSRRQLDASIIEAARHETGAILASGIAHDFNNAMGALLGNVELLRMKADDDSARKLDRMEKIIRRSSAMTRRLVAAVRGGDVEMSPIDLREPLQSAVDLTRPMLPGEIVLDLRIAADLPRVLGNANELEHALLNLILNARDAMPEGGRILIGATRVVQGPYAGGACVSVEDEGPGVPEALQAKIWEPFFTTKGSGRGTGLGLPMVSRVARAHGGGVDVGTALGGRGARFNLYIPPTEHTGTLSTGGVRVSARVLVVDDDPDVLEHMRVELTARSCKATATNNAEQAERLFEEAGGNFDLLVTDAVMPGMSGIVLARRLTARRPGLAVLVVSGFIPQNEPALDPSWGRLEKPFSSEQFAVAVRRTMMRALRAQGSGPPT